MSLGAVGTDARIRPVVYAEFLASISANLELAMLLLDGQDYPIHEREVMERILWQARAAAEAASQQATRANLRGSQAPPF